MNSKHKDMKVKTGITKTAFTDISVFFSDNDLNSWITVQVSEWKIKRSLVNFVRLEKTVTEMVTGCLRRMKSCYMSQIKFGSISNSSFTTVYTNSEHPPLHS